MIAKLVLQLDQSGVANPKRDARLLVALSLGIDLGRLTLHLHDPVDDGAFERAQALVERRKAREPMSHILGYREFYGRRFDVGPDVLDPRPETETLIEAALSYPFQRILDLGTGSGCILLTLLAEREGSKGVGIDLSDAALTVARRNAEALGVTDRITFVQSDWYQTVDGPFDLIVSNPPYIASDEMATLAPEVQKHEPRMALTDEADGLTFYRRIVSGCMNHLEPNGRLLVEIGPTQAVAVSDMMDKAGLSNVTVFRDLDGRDRVVSGRRGAE
ncbi:peptide chain release factor N(5)-glutamine methyltransferase [Cognatiyoonia sp.]|uniref:peptide chain release factor N(5)-glutamine methyltransferase n=1 Tax=Cognatiyoonia sp. TaxID=2211652 RepID=UPI003F69B1BC